MKVLRAIICRYQQRIVHLWYQRNGGDAQVIKNLGHLLITIIITTTSTVPTVTYQWMATMDKIAAEIDLLQFCL